MESYHCYMCGITFDVKKTGASKMHELNFDKAEIEYCPYCGNSSLIMNAMIQLMDRKE